MLTLFFEELKAILEQVTTLSIPIVVFDDANVRLDRPEDVWIIRFTDMLTSFGFAQRVELSSRESNNQLTTRTAF